MVLARVTAAGCARPRWNRMTIGPTSPVAPPSAPDPAPTASRAASPGSAW